MKYVAIFYIDNRISEGVQTSYTLAVVYKCCHMKTVYYKVNNVSECKSLCNSRKYKQNLLWVTKYINLTSMFVSLGKCSYCTFLVLFNELSSNALLTLL